MTSLHAKKIEPPKPITMAEFVEEYGRKLRDESIFAELDYSFVNDAIMIHDMRKQEGRGTVPRCAKLYTRQEVERGAYKRSGDFDRRVKAFMAGGF